MHGITFLGRTVNAPMTSLELRKHLPLACTLGVTSRIHGFVSSARGYGATWKVAVPGRETGGRECLCHMSCGPTWAPGHIYT
jgi:hypothetical protein